MITPVYIVGLVIGMLALLGGIALIIFFMISSYIGRRKASIRVEAARALGKMGIDSEEAILALEKALNDPKSNVRRESALSLGKLGSLAKIAVPSLVKALNDKNPDVRWRASEALGFIGVNTEDVISSLNELIHDECDYVCESAINALDSLTEEEELSYIKE
ncbi:MAG: HEAT repeat domain-containing protein [Candidatus Hodarchaeota archaeon]